MDQGLRGQTMGRKHPHHPATATDIVRIVGPIDDRVIAEIIAAGATVGDVTEANAWLNARDYFRRVAHDTAHGRIAHIYHLLDAERAHPNKAAPHAASRLAQAAAKLIHKRQ
jgi:hypothetical protein